MLVPKIKMSHIPTIPGTPALAKKIYIYSHKKRGKNLDKRGGKHEIEGALKVTRIECRSFFLDSKVHLPPKLSPFEWKIRWAWDWDR